MKFDNKQQAELEALVAIIAASTEAEIDLDDEDANEEDEIEETKDVSEKVFRLITWLEEKGHTADEIIECIRVIAGE